MPKEARPLCFGPTDILLPQNCNMPQWSVVACDQYTSQPEYWTRVEQYVGAAPSALRLILPELYLEQPGVEHRIREINHTMGEYVKDGLFKTLPACFVYVERVLDDGRVRRGLVGAVDLEQYDYTPGTDAPIRATEGTVLSRIPPRVAVRKNAPIELPHVMMLIDDPQDTIIGPLAREAEKLPLLYDFDLMERGGHITGRQVSGGAADRVTQALTVLADPEAWARKFGPDCPVMLLASGDGNHSLATAKEHYERCKKLAPESEHATMPARFALVELVNLHDASLQFEPIHRIVTGVEPEALLSALRLAHREAYEGEGDGHVLRFLTQARKGAITVPHPTVQLPVGTLQDFLDDYLLQHGGSIDYIHGEDVVAELSNRPDTVGFLLDGIEKSSLFLAVMFDGVLPRKTFSMGHAHDKRFYLECRKIR